MSLIDLYRNRVATDAEAKLKDKVKEVVRSYRHSWDIYSELLQNAVDAINRRYAILNDPDYYLYDEFHTNHGVTSDNTYQGKITIYVDVPERVVQITDNGVGIPSDSIDKFLLPDESGKRLGKDYGFKGYGLTFAAFISDEFSLKSRHFLSNDTNEIGFHGLFQWLHSDPPVAFPRGPIATSSPSASPLDGTDENTTVRVKLNSDYSSKFAAIAAADIALQFIKNSSDWPRFHYILRTRTAIGNTKLLFNKPPYVPISIEAKVRFEDGHEEAQAIDYSFFHPKDQPEVNVTLYDFADYVQRIPLASFTNREFSGLLFNTTECSVGTRNQLVCDMSILAVQTTRLTAIESRLGIDSLNTVDLSLTYGVHLSINGMPTGIRIDDWDMKGNDRKRFYCLVDADLGISGQLDSGRKGISSYFGTLVSDDAWKIIRETKIGNSDTFLRYVGKYLDQSAVTMVLNPSPLPDKVRQVVQEGEPILLAQPDLATKLHGLSPLRFFPRDEQEVIALFYSLLSRGHIKGYRTTYISTRATYDAAFDYAIECSPDNSFPTDRLGIGRPLVEQMRARGESIYEHRTQYASLRMSPDLCIEFKWSVGDLLEELRRTANTDKEARDIDILIVWSRDVPPSVSSNDYYLTEVQDNQRIFHSTTHRLGIRFGPYPTEMWCIVLSDVLAI